MGISSTRTRLFGLSFVAVLAAFLLAVPSIALSGPPANTACFECHAAAGGATSKVDFAAPADLSGCEACHRYGVHDFDDFHVAQNAAPDYMSKQCSGCHHSHATYGPRPALTGWPTVFTASGWFQSAASLSASSGALHAIHANGSWLKDQPECASCHGAAACTACHAPPADDHADHASLGTRAIASVASIGRKSGDAVSDTYLYSSAATGNYSSGTTLYVGRTSSGEERSLLRFPLTGLSGSTATTATLVLTRVGASAFPLRAYRLRRSDWSAANWNTYKPGSSWSAPGAGADYYPELFAESAGTTFDITALLSAALAAGDSSLDLIVLDPAPVARRYTGFYSSECLVAAWAPALNVSVTRPTQLYAYGPVAGTEPGSPSLPAYVTPTRGCLASACHDLDAAGAVSLAPTCVSCHPDRSVAHGFDPEKHMSTETCLGVCHSAELATTHDAVTPSVVCADCHAVQVPAIKPWDKTCSACHLVIDHATADHTGTDAAVRASRGYPYGGCSDTLPYQTGCHVISNVSALHDDLPDHGCALCHGAGKTPTRECRTCHPQNDPQTSESFVATFYPTADGPVVGTTVSSSGSSRWDVVDEPNPGDGDSTYFQFSSAGSAMFTAVHAVPSTATITSVVIYARARTGSATTKSYYPMVSVGGTTYSRAGTNIASAYTGGQGVAYSLTTNPKTGAAWQPSELNSTGGANSLDYFGVGTSNASALANQWLRVTQCSVVVNYKVAITPPAGALLGGTWYHHNNNKYLFDASDAVPGTSYFSGGYPAHGWNDALYYQDCNDLCHHDTANPSPTFTAYEGTRMWYSTAGAYFPETRTLTLSAITVPASSPKLDFMTNWRMSGSDAGYVEVSTNGGASYAPLTGTVGGVGRSSLTGNAATWVPASYDLTPYSGQVVKIRFRFVVNDGAVGWALDNVAISGSGATVFSDNAETLSPEWTNYHWARSQGAYPFF